MNVSYNRILHVPAPQTTRIIQPRPNLLDGNESAPEHSGPLPTDLPPNYEDSSEQPPPWYEEYLIQGNEFIRALELSNDHGNESDLELSESLATDLPPDYEDIEQPPPSYEEYLVQGIVNGI